MSFTITKQIGSLFRRLSVAVLLVRKQIWCCGRSRMASLWLDALIFLINAIWLPNTLLEASVSAESCTRCGPGTVYRIHFKFKQGEIPPQYATEYTGCVGGCDSILKELIEICGIGIRSSSGGSQAGNRGANIGQNNTRHDQRGTSHQDQRPVHNPTNSVTCHCQQVCTLLTAQTESNRGRRFYRCASNSCDFFLWEQSASAQVDASDIPTSTRRGRGGGGRAERSGNTQARPPRNNQVTRGRTNAGTGRTRTSRGTEAGRGGAFVRATGEAVSTNSCFVCGETSHWANSCPNRNSS